MAGYHYLRARRAEIGRHVPESLTTMSTFTKPKTRRQLRHPASRSKSHMLDKQQGEVHQGTSWVGLDAPQRRQATAQEVLTTTFAPWAATWAEAALATKKDPLVWLAAQARKAGSSSSAIITSGHLAPKTRGMCQNL
jgi:hypothetical protein